MSSSTIFLVLICLIPRVSYAQCIERSPPLPELFLYPQASFLPSLSRFYVFGGENDAYIWKWDTTGPLQWVNMGSTPDSNGFNSYANAIAEIDTLLYFVGLNIDASSILIFDATTEAWLDTSHIPDSPNGGVDGCVTHNNSHIFYVGGDINDIGDELQIYNIAQNTWTATSISITAIEGNNYWGQFCWMIDNTLYVFGGTTNRKNIDKIYKWQEDVGWSEVGDLPATISEGIAVKHPLDNHIFLLGGYLGRSGDATADTIYQFNVDTESITNTYYMTTALKVFSADFIDNDLYTVGGLDDKHDGSDIIQMCSGLVDAMTSSTSTTTTTSTTSTTSTSAPTEKPTTSTSTSTLVPTEKPTSTTSTTSTSTTSSTPIPTPIPTTSMPTTKPSIAPTETPTTSAANPETTLPPIYTSLQSLETSSSISTSLIPTVLESKSTSVADTDTISTILTTEATNMDTTSFMGTTANRISSTMSTFVVTYDTKHDAIDGGASDKINRSLNTYIAIGVSGFVIPVIVGMIICGCIYCRNIENRKNVLNISDPSVMDSGDTIQRNTIASNDPYNDYNPVFVAWFVHTLQLPQYLDTFVKNGYDNVLMLELIEDKSQLKEMDIGKRGHQELIMHEIDKLRKKKSVKKKVKQVELRVLRGRPGEKSVCESEVGDTFTEEGNVNENGGNNNNIEDKSKGKKSTVIGGVKC